MAARCATICVSGFALSCILSVIDPSIYTAKTYRHHRENSISKPKWYPNPNPNGLTRLPKLAATLASLSRNSFIFSMHIPAVSETNSHRLTLWEGIKLERGIARISFKDVVRKDSVACGRQGHEHYREAHHNHLPHHLDRHRRHPHREDTYMTSALRGGGEGTLKSRHSNKA